MHPTSCALSTKPSKVSGEEWNLTSAEISAMDIQGAADLTDLDEPSPIGSPQEMTLQEMAREGYYPMKALIDCKCN